MGTVQPLTGQRKTVEVPHNKLGIGPSCSPGSPALSPYLNPCPNPDWCSMSILKEKKNRSMIHLCILAWNTPNLTHASSNTQSLIPTATISKVEIREMCEARLGKVIALLSG